MRSAERALMLDDNDAEMHRILGSINLTLRNYERAERHVLRALEINPNHSYVVAQAGELYNYLGRSERALQLLDQARVLDPFLPDYSRAEEAVAHYLLGHYDRAMAVIAQLDHLSVRSAAYRAAAATHLGDDGAVVAATRDVLRIDPDFSTDRFLASQHYRDPAPRERLGADLKAAGLPA